MGQMEWSHWIIWNAFKIPLHEFNSASAMKAIRHALRQAEDKLPAVFSGLIVWSAIDTAYRTYFVTSNDFF